MNDISKEQVWALRSAAANGSLTGPLATVTLCDNLLAAWKERDEAHRNLDNIKSSRAKDAAAEGFEQRPEYPAYRVLAAVREAARCPFGKNITEHVAVMRDRLGRYEDEQEQVRSILGATEVETLDDAADRVAKEAEGLYRFKCRIREALGAEKGVDMAAEVRRLKAAPRVGVNVGALITALIRDCLYDLCEDAGIDWPGETLGGTEPVRHAIVAAIKNGEGSKHNDTAMRQNLAEKTAECEKLQARVRVLESTIREHEKDLKAIEELQDEQTKLNAVLMRMAEGKRITARGVPVVPDRSCRHTWGWLICRGKANA